jgi:hypothetical protein
VSLLERHYKGSYELVTMRGLSTSHQEARSSPCCGDVLGSKGRKSSSRRRSLTKSRLVCYESTGVILVELCHKGRPSELSRTGVKNECAISISCPFKLHNVMLTRKQSYILKQENCVHTHNESMLRASNNWKNLLTLG